MLAFTRPSLGFSEIAIDFPDYSSAVCSGGLIIVYYMP